VLCAAPQTPLLFMGQEWAASTPFQYFTDHAEPLGALVTEGRQREFAAFLAFRADTTERIPDPQAAATFAASCLQWDEREAEPHASVLRLYAALLALRRGWQPVAADDARALALDEDTVAVRRTTVDGAAALLVARLRGGGVVDLAAHALAPPDVRWRCRLTTEDVAFTPTPAPPDLDGLPALPRIRFHAPAAVVLESRPLDLSAAHHDA
jgi:maltooligosyltrehalose trehalohydrolase